MNKTAYISGKSYFSMTTRKDTKGKYPSNSYVVGITDVLIDDNNHEIIEKYLKQTKDKDGNMVEHITIKNSLYQIPMFDKDNKRITDCVPIPNGTDITIYVEERYNSVYDTDFLVCKAIRVNEDIKPYNPFLQIKGMI